MADRGGRRSHAASSCAAARCCSRSAPSPTGRSAAPTRRRHCGARSSRSRSACSWFTTIACASRRPMDARPESRAACSRSASATTARFTLGRDARRSPARGRAAQPARAPESQPDRPRAPGRRVAECDLARRARSVRPLARHAPRPLGTPQRHARRAAARRRRARLPAGAPTRSERAQQLEPAAAARRPGRGHARVPRTPAGPCLGRARRAPQGRRGRRPSRAGSSRSSSASGAPPCVRARHWSRKRSSITGWRNVGESEAMLFWILRDPRRAESV